MKLTADPLDIRRQRGKANISKYRLSVGLHGRFESAPARICLFKQHGIAEMTLAPVLYAYSLPGLDFACGFQIHGPDAVRALFKKQALKRSSTKAPREKTSRQDLRIIEHETIARQEKIA